MTSAPGDAFFESHLQPAESLLWVSAPGHRRVNDPTTRRFVIGMVIAFAAMCLGLSVAVPQVIPFMLGGVIIVGTYLLMGWNLDGGRTHCGLTNRRVLIGRGLMRPQLEAIDLLDIGEVRCFKTRAGAVCLELVAEVNRFLLPPPVRGSRYDFDIPDGPRLYGLADPDAVRERILAAQRALVEPLPQAASAAGSRPA